MANKIKLMTLAVAMSLPVLPTSAEASIGYVGPSAAAEVSCGNTYIHVKGQVGPTAGYERGQWIGMTVRIYDWQTNRYIYDQTTWSVVATVAHGSYSYLSIQSPDAYGLTWTQPHVDVPAPRNGSYSVGVTYTWINSNLTAVIGASDQLWGWYTNWTNPTGRMALSQSGARFCTIQPGWNQVAYSAH